MSILNDSGLSSINSVLNLKTIFSKETVESLLRRQSTFPSISTVLNNQKVVSQLRTINEDSKKDISTILEKLVQNEKDLQFFFDEDNSLENLENDTFGQLLFQHSELKILNTFPFLIMIMSYIKIYFIPLISVTLPVLMYFLPYLIIKYVWNMPMSYEMYQNIMGKMWSFSFDGSIEKLLQNAFTIFTFAQSMYQPIQNALHLSTINSTIYNLGSTLYSFTDNIRSLKSILQRNSVSFKIDNLLESFCDSSDYRKNFSTILDNPSYLFLVSYRLSNFELLFTISNNQRFNKVNLYDSTTPYLNIKECADINLDENSCVGSDFKIDDSSTHFLMSGPNGGGKSSFLRAILQTVLFSQSFGYAIGESIDISIFDYIFSGLHIQDIPGEKSLFEKEVCFARDVLDFNNPKFKALVLFDEIFHSTNPPDGIKTANKFLEKLYSYKHISSIISTHVFEIIENAPDFVKRICVNAKIVDDNLFYDYKLSNGICKISSVSEIWKKSYA
jgi:hypothetical protein